MVFTSSDFLLPTIVYLNSFKADYEPDADPDSDSDPELCWAPMPFSKQLFMRRGAPGDA